MARPENPIDPGAGPVAEFAQELRTLRELAGITYRELAQRAHFSLGALSSAARGTRMPSWEITKAYVLGCGGDEEEWYQRWNAVVAALDSRDKDPPSERLKERKASRGADKSAPSVPASRTPPPVRASRSSTPAEAAPDPVAELWRHVERALADNKSPTPREIERLATELGYRLPASTIRGWLRSRPVPAWQRFEALLIALGAEQDLNWQTLWMAAANAARTQKAAGQHRRDDGEHLEVEASPSQLDARSTLRSSFKRPPILGLVALLVGSLLLITLWSFGVREGPMPASGAARTAAPATPAAICAHVVWKTAAVYASPNPRARLIRYKYLGESVVLFDPGRDHPNWRAIRTPTDRPGWGWVQASSLAKAPCS